MRWIMAAAIWFSTAAPAVQATEPVQVMVLGTYHFANPGQDIINFKADDVLQPKRQAELQALAKALAEWKPTKVMVEREAKTPDLIDPNFANFTPAELAKDRDERAQIGYRTAHGLRLPVVYAIDESSDEGEPDYFPFGKLVEYDKKHGKGDLMDRFKARGAQWMADFEAKQPRLSIPAILAEANHPEFQGGMDVQYEMLAIGDTVEQPGAELNAYWYMRNAKIFAKLMTVAKPGDRILIVYGSGHNYWLRHFAKETPGYLSVDPVPYLNKATKALP